VPFPPRSHSTACKWPSSDEQRRARIYARGWPSAGVRPSTEIRGTIGCFGARSVPKHALSVPEHAESAPERDPSTLHRTTLALLKPKEAIGGGIFNVRGDSRWMGLARVLCASTVFDRWRLKSNIRLSAHQWTSIESQSRDTSSIGLKLVCLVHKGGQLTWLPLEGNTTCTPSIEVLPRHRETGPAR